MDSESQSTKVAKPLSVLSQDSNKSVRPQAKLNSAIPDSWEEEGDPESDHDQEGGTEQEDGNNDMPSAPPPTPCSPSYGSLRPWTAHGGETSPISSRSPDLSSGRRPEKTDAVARRMIAGALGLKAPKQTEEQKVYQKAIAEKERKRREEEKADAQKQMDEVERARAAIWND